MNELVQLPISDDLYDMLTLDAIEAYRGRKDFLAYQYNGVNVPRVTKILDDCMNREYLIMWAVNLGKYGYLNEKDFATSVGSKVHEMIEHFLQTGEDLDIEYKKAPKQAPVINRAYNNFKRWYTKLINDGNKFELIGLEIPLICPFYAGTCDCICKINGAIYILDFKTSKKISYEYFIQICAYKWMIDNGFLLEYNIKHIDGVGIIRVDKESHEYEDLFLNEFNIEQNKIINDYIKGFFSILNTYYNKLNMEYIFSQYKKKYPGLNEIISVVED